MLLGRCLIAPTKSLSNHQQSRTFLNLSNGLAALSAISSGNKPLHFHTNKVLPYPKAALYGLVTDIKAYPKFLPFIAEAQILQHASIVESKQLPALASLTVGVPQQLQDMKLIDTRIAFISNVYCIPSRGLVEAVAGEERACQNAGTDELIANGYAAIPARPADGAQDRGPDIFKFCRTRWLMTELAKDKTEVDLRIEIQWKNAVLAGLTQTAAPMMAETMMEAFEKRARETLP